MIKPYLRMIKNDFIAELKFLTSEQGGRKGNVKSGYRPHIEFDNYPENLTSGRQSYIGKEFVEPGEKALAEIAFLATKYFTKRLYENMTFKFCEGPNIIGYGKITEILNLELRTDKNILLESINLNLYPSDIKNQIKIDFGDDYNQAIVKLQELIISDKTFQSDRIIRAIIYLGNKDIKHLIKIIDEVKIDWRDILMYAEYDDKGNRIRNFNNEFGQENI